MNRIKIYTDGGSRGNPGPSAIAVIVCDENDNILEEHTERIQDGTNNTAEYRAILCGLDRGTSHCCIDVRICADSDLAVKQLNRIWRIHEPHLRRLVEEVRSKERFYETVSYVYVSRNHPMLSRADRLLNGKLDEEIGL